MMKETCVVGLDLAGVSHRPTGVCVLIGWRASHLILHADEEILGYVQKKRPALVAIDAPLSLPPGRKSIHERGSQHFRLCDEELQKRKIPFFPITLGPMRMLTERGISLKNSLEEMGFRVIEIYPGGAQDIWGIPRAKRSISGLKQGLSRLGIVGLKRKITDHELDAASGALVGQLFLQGKAEVYGDYSRGAIIMPRFLR